MILGVGINDAEYKVTQLKGGVQWMCPIYSAWKSMLTRCYGKRIASAYVGCTVDEAWHRFSEFSVWAKTHYVEGFDLDKDIILPGNKVYSALVCSFVPPYVNRVLSNKSSGVLPTGVCEIKRDVPNKYVSYHDSFGKGREHLGTFLTPEEAHRAWQVAKVKDIRAVISHWKDSQIGVDLRVTNSLELRALQLEEDHRTHNVTEGL